MDTPSRSESEARERLEGEVYARQFEGEHLEGIQNRPVYCFAKRSFDIMFSLLMLVAFCWLFAIIAILVKLGDPKGLVFFKQDRVGKAGRIFKMHMFRSMVVDAEECLGELKALNENTGPVFKMREDPRVTRTGRWLRKLSLVSVIIGTLGDGGSAKSLSHSAKSSLELQLCESSPGLCFANDLHNKPCKFMSSGISGGVLDLPRKLIGRNSSIFSRDPRFTFLSWDSEKVGLGRHGKGESKYRKPAQ